MAQSRREEEDETLDLAPESEDCEDAYSVEYLLECATDETRSERLAELQRRIAQGAYRVDPARIAEFFLTRRTASDN